MMSKKWIQSVGAVTAAIMAAGYIQAMAAQDETVTAKDDSPASITSDQKPRVEVSAQAAIAPEQTLPQPADMLVREIKVFPVF
jgi:hypothetical protein